MDSLKSSGAWGTCGFLIITYNLGLESLPPLNCHQVIQYITNADHSSKIGYGFTLYTGYCQSIVLNTTSIMCFFLSMGPVDLYVYRAFYQEMFYNGIYENYFGMVSHHPYNHLPLFKPALDILNDTMIVILILFLHY